MNADKPRDFTPEATFGALMMRPLYARFTEAHRVTKREDGDDEMGPLDGDEDEESMNNAWFEGTTGSTEFKIKDKYGGSGADEEREVEVTVTDSRSRKRRAVFPCFTRKRRRMSRSEDGGEERQPMGLGIGNDAFGKGEKERAYVLTDVEDPEEVEVRYEHDASTCEECQGRERIARQLKKEKEREKMFESVGLGLSSSTSSHHYHEPEDKMDVEEVPSSSTPSQDEYDSDQDDDWEALIPTSTDEYGNVYEPIPRTHDRKKLADKSRCDGVKEIFLFGEAINSSLNFQHRFFKLTSFLDRPQT